MNGTHGRELDNRRGWVGLCHSCTITAGGEHAKQSPDATGNGPGTELCVRWLTKGQRPEEEKQSALERDEAEGK